MIPFFVKMAALIVSAASVVANFHGRHLFTVLLNLIFLANVHSYCVLCDDTEPVEDPSFLFLLARMSSVRS